MDTKKIKRIVAREGLILLSLMITSLLGGIIFYFWAWNRYASYASKNPGSGVIPPTPGECMVWVSSILSGVWVVYIIVRFYVWAIRTLKKKEIG